MSHEPTPEEWRAAVLVYDDGPGDMEAAIAAANTLRDPRTRNAALEEAAALFEGPTGGSQWWIAKTIRALKDKTDE